MGKVSDITPRKKAKISTLLTNTNYSVRRIANLESVSAATVSRIRRKLDLGESFDVKRLGKCGRKRITTERDDRKILHVIKTARKSAIGEIRHELEEQGIKLSTRTLKRRCYEAGFYCRRPQRKPKLTPTMKKKRKDWAKEVQNFSVDDWRNVCFSDESSFQILNDKSTFVRRRPGEEYDPDCIVNTVKHPTSVMVWSVISGKGVGRLYVVEGTLRQDQYKKIIETRLVPQLKEWFKNGERFLFMQDGAPCHTARSVLDLLRNQNIPLLSWPGNSPDMNPIENLWELVKKRVNRISITTRQQLIEQLIAVWHRDPDIAQLAQKCIDSMPRRIEALKKAKGGITKY